MLSHPYVVRFIALVAEWNAAGLAEYLLFETIEGRRDRPFKLLDPLPPKTMDELRKIRDELKVWPYWDEQNSCWQLAPIDAWRDHTLETNANDISRMLEHRNVRAS